MQILAKWKKTTRARVLFHWRTLLLSSEMGSHDSQSRFSYTKRTVSLFRFFASLSQVNAINIQSMQSTFTPKRTKLFSLEFTCLF